MITIEMIDEFRSRTNASYDDARYFLERNNGDMLEAVIEFERIRNAGQSHRCRQGHFGRSIMRVVQRLLDIKITITDKTARTVNVPLLFPLVLIPFWHVIVLLGIIMMMMGFRFGIADIKDDNMNVESIVNRVREKMRAGKNC